MFSSRASKLKYGDAPLQIKNKSSDGSVKFVCLLLLKVVSSATAPSCSAVPYTMNSVVLGGFFHRKQSYIVTVYVSLKYGHHVQRSYELRMKRVLLVGSDISVAPLSTYPLDTT